MSIIEGRGERVAERSVMQMALEAAAAGQKPSEQKVVEETTGETPMPEVETTTRVFIDPQPEAASQQTNAEESVQPKIKLSKKQKQALKEEREKAERKADRKAAKAAAKIQPTVVTTDRRTTKKGAEILTINFGTGADIDGSFKKSKKTKKAKKPNAVMRTVDKVTSPVLGWWNKPAKVMDPISIKLPFGRNQAKKLDSFMSGRMEMLGNMLSSTAADLKDRTKAA